MNDGAREFRPTRWSLVLAARSSDVERARAALAELCEAYWYPLYAFVRRKGCDAEAAQDVVQGFFARLLERDGLARVERGRGRFRAFLKVALEHHWADERDRARAAKRGGGETPLSLDFERADSRWRLEPASAETPERAYERRFALELLGRALHAVEHEYAERGDAATWSSLREHLTAGATTPHRDAAAALGLTEGAVKVAVHRMRKRFRDALRAEVAAIVDDPREIDDELACLLAALSS